MKVIKSLPLLVIFLLSITTIKSQQQAATNGSDSLTLAQAFINLSLTETYFDSISLNRIDKIIPYEQEELNSLKNKTFQDKNATIYNLAWSMLYFNKAKRFSKTTTTPTRKQLLQWKNALDSAHYFYRSINIAYNYFIEKKTDPYFELIGFNEKIYFKLDNDLYEFRGLFSGYFSRDIYPDYQRIFYAFKNSNTFYFDSLKYYASLYSMPLYLSEVEDVPELKKEFEFNATTPYLGTHYGMSQALDLIARYLQYQYLASDKVSNSITLNKNRFYESYDDFVSKLNLNDKHKFLYEDGIIGKDDFFNNELNESATTALLKLLKTKFPDDGIRTYPNQNVGSAGPDDIYLTKYYFPNPAPFPSAAAYVNNFRPGLRTMKQVDNYLVTNFTNAGYAGHLRYYYVKSGFAITSNLEKINKDGSPVTGTARWNVSPGGNGSFSLYQVFKSIFFETESHFRMFAFIIAPKKPDLDSRPPSLSAMQDLIKYSYPSLPSDIHNSVLDYKTLSILVYHFLQSDIGEVPMLETKNALPVKKHLANSKLAALLVR